MAGHVLAMKYNVGLNTDGRKPRIVDDTYKSNLVTGDGVKTRASGSVPHGAEERPNNQYGRPRIIAGKGGKK